MIDLLLAPIDPSRAHDVSAGMAWHGRFMVIGWGVLCPLAIVIARYFKISARQAWPQELDNHLWWRAHWMGQMLAMGLSAIALALILVTPTDGGTSLHRGVGYLILAFGAMQLLSGLFRGSKGGPHEAILHGDHFDMTLHRRAFERLHRTVGYSALALAAFAILSGMWAANAPIWMWAVIGGWWSALVTATVWLQLQGRAYDTYQAIYGPDPDLPGNRIGQQGWATVRPGDTLTPRNRIGE
jgi:hypothetical protein